MNESLHSWKKRLDSAAAKFGREVKIMEVCGTHTVSAFRCGLRSLLPDNVELISGPGCPVCVTAQEYIDGVVDLCRSGKATIATYGDMVRVPGTGGSLETARADGGEVRVVYSVLDALKLSAKRAPRPVVFVAVGFETTAPATAAAVKEANKNGIDNFYILSAHKLVMPAMMALLEDGKAQIDGFLCPGHVSVIIGSDAYSPIAERFGRPCVVAGFEAGQMLAGITRIVEQLLDGGSGVESVYAGVVSKDGNRVAQQLLEEVFEPADERWRGLGRIPESGLALRSDFERFDGFREFDVKMEETDDLPGCSCGLVITGRLSPVQCPLFGNTCTPVNPMGPCMVSSEGSCSAWFKYRDRRSG
jgi:hydrogenase expression/formation protein HypD